MKKSRTEAEKGVIALIFLTAIFTMMSVLARYLNDGFTILQQVYLRIFVASVLAIVMFRQDIRWQRLLRMPAREWLILAFRGLMAYGLAVTLISKAVTLTLIGNVSFIAALPFVPVLGFLFLKEKVTWWKLAAIAGSLIGVGLLAITNFHDVFAWGRGDVVAIISNVAFAMSYIARRWHGPTLNNKEMTTLTLLFGTVIVFVMSMALGEGAPHVHLAWTSWTLWAVILLGGALNVANQLLVNYSFQHLDAVRAGNLLNLECAWGLLFGLLFYHEWPSWRGLVGGIVIVSCVIALNIRSQREEAKLAAMEVESAT